MTSQATIILRNGLMTLFLFSGPLGPSDSHVTLSSNVELVKMTRQVFPRNRQKTKLLGHFFVYPSVDCHTLIALPHIRAWYGMEDDFSIFHTGNFLPFHTKNLLFHIPFHTKIFFHIQFHTKIFFHIPFHTSIPKKF